jgi:hypothetical protein
MTVSDATWHPGLRNPCRHLLARAAPAKRGERVSAGLRRRHAREGRFSRPMLLRIARSTKDGLAYLYPIGYR